MLPKFTLFREERECLMHHPVISVGMFMNIKHPISSQITTLVSSELPFQQKIDAITQKPERMPWSYAWRKTMPALSSKR